MALFGAARALVVAYEACAVDVYRAFGGSWFVGALLAFWYAVCLVAGLVIGATMYELLDPILFAVTLLMPAGAGIALELVTLVILLLVATSFLLIVARFLVKGLTYLLFEMGGDTLFYVLLIVTFGCVLCFAGATLLPPVVAEDALVLIGGISGLVAVAFAVLTAWVFVRYRWAGHPRGRAFDRDIGLAWSHMGDPRRARFGFEWPRP